MPPLYDPILDSPLFDIFADSASDTYFFAYDLRSGYSRWSKSAVQEFGMPGEYMPDARSAWLPHIHPEDRAVYEKKLDELFSGSGDGVHSCEYRTRSRDGTYLWVRCKGLLRRDARGEPFLFAGVINNLGPVAKYDYVTGLYTIHELNRRVSNTQASASGALLLGLDGFHQINDSHGYRFGNRLLRALAESLVKRFPEGSFYRMDGDKFAYVQPGADRARMRAAFEACRQCADVLTLDDRPVPLSLTGGCVFYPADGTDLDTLYSRADMAMNAAKRMQPGRMLFYTATLCAAEQRRSDLTSALHRDVLNRCAHFELFFQPLLSTRTMDGHHAPGAEVLLRWHNKDFPDAGPAEFIPLLESNGDIVNVGTWVLEQSLRQCRAWMALDGGFPGVSVNVSYQQIIQEDFCDTACRLFAESGLPFGSLCLELTESCRIADLAFLRETMNELQLHGIMTALDDFGTGYASFSVLKSLTPSWIKIDHTLSRDAANNLADRAILSAILSLSAQLGIHSCVEGIETPALEQTAVGAGADLLQGYLYARPMSADAFARRYVGQSALLQLGGNASG